MESMGLGQNGEQNGNESNSLERLQQRLYSPQPTAPILPPSLSQQQVPRVQQWQAPPPPKPPKHHISWTVLFLGGAIAFFIIAGLLSFLFLWLGGRALSSNNLTIAVQGPTTIASGQTVPLSISIQNHNPATITDATISVDFPTGTRSVSDITQPFLRYTNSIGSITSGGTSNQSVQAVLFGSTNQSVTIPITVQYHTANSNAVFTTVKNYTITITSSPVTITANTVSSIAAGQPFSIQVSVRSNATTPLQNIALAATYPPGFMPLDNGTTTGPIFGLGTLNPGQEKNITINGTLSGSNNDQLDFDFTAGTENADGTSGLADAFGSEEDTITISKPFLSADLSINNSDTDPIVVVPGQPITGTVAWSNTLNTPITNGQVAVQLTGAVNPGTISATDGYYDSAHSAVVFTKSTQTSLATLNPGSSGTGSFSFGTLTGTSLNALTNPTIKLSVSISGQPGTGSSQTISNTITRTVEIATNLELATQIVHSTGPFTNTGPWPPQANTPTTYTVLLSVSNTVNDVGGGTVRMILPPYVTFTGAVQPNDNSITYDDSSRTVTWKIGDVPSDTGYGSTQPITAAFQVSFTPSSTQVNTSPILIENQSITGVDRFTGATVGNTVPALTTQTTTDPAYQATFGNVAN